MKADVVDVQGPELANSVQTSAANAAQAITITGAAKRRTTLRQLIIFSSAAGTSTLTVTIGGVVRANLGSIALTTELKSFLILITADEGLTLVVDVGAAGAAVTTTLTVIADRQ